MTPAPAVPPGVQRFLPDMGPDDVDRAVVMGDQIEGFRVEVGWTPNGAAVSVMTACPTSLPFIKDIEKTTVDMVNTALSDAAPVLAATPCRLRDGRPGLFCLHIFVRIGDGGGGVWRLAYDIAPEMAALVGGRIDDLKGRVADAIFYRAVRGMEAYARAYYAGAIPE